MAESCNSSENENIIFTIQDGVVKILFQDKYHTTGYFDITEDEKKTRNIELYRRNYD